MISTQQIEELAEKIRAAFNPEKIVLFGSYAYGTPRLDSDVDLLVVMPYEGGDVRQAVSIVQTVMPPSSSPLFGIDVVVRRPDELQQRLADGDFFLREIMSKGRILYDTTHAGMG